MAMTIEQLIDIVNQDLTVSGLFPKILPNKEIYRLIKEHAAEWFYKNYQFALIKTYYYLPYDCFKEDIYAKYKFFIMPEEVENIVRVIKISDPSLFRIGIQAPHLSLNLGVTNQPFLTSFVTTIGDLAVYRSVISAFSDEINKMSLETVKFTYNHIDKRFHVLTNIDTSLFLEIYTRIELEELFDFQYFKDYIIGISRIRQGEVVGRLNFQLPGNFSYNANDMIQSGKDLVQDVKDKISKETTTSWFFMSR